MEIDRKQLNDAIRANDSGRLAQVCSGFTLASFSDKQQADHLLTKAMQRSVGTDVLQVLIDFGVDPHAIPKRDGFSPLRKAIQLKRLDYLQFLLEIGVDPNRGLGAQRITLTAISQSNPSSLQIQILQKLVEHGVDLNHTFSWFGKQDELFTVLDHAEEGEVKDYLRSVGAKTASELTEHESAKELSSSGGYRDEVHGCLEKLFGAAEERSFRDILTADSGISVHVIKPASPEGFITLYTTGMSARPMAVPHELTDHAYGELYMQLPSDWDLKSSKAQDLWPVQLLLDLASYPAGNDAFFAVPVTTIANGDPPEPLGPNVRFTASALLADEGFERSDGKIVNLFCVMPVYLEEAELARRSIPEFLNALDASGTSRILSLDRPSVVK